MTVAPGTFPATSRSVLAGTSWKAPERFVAMRALHEPAHAPVTLKVTVLLELLSTSVPANVTVRVVMLLPR